MNKFLFLLFICIIFVQCSNIFALSPGSYFIDEEKSISIDWISPYNETKDGINACFTFKGKRQQMRLEVLSREFINESEYVYSSDGTSQQCWIDDTGIEYLKWYQNTVLKLERTYNKTGKTRSVKEKFALIITSKERHIGKIWATIDWEKKEVYIDFINIEKQEREKGYNTLATALFKVFLLKEGCESFNIATKMLKKNRMSPFGGRSFIRVFGSKTIYDAQYPPSRVIESAVRTEQAVRTYIKLSL